MKRYKLIDIAELVADRVQFFDGLKPFASTGAVNDFEQINPEYVTYQEKPSRADLTVRVGDICFARMLGTKKVFSVNEKNSEYIYSTGFAIVRPVKNVVHSRYLFHVINSNEFQTKKDSLCSGATQKAIANEKLKTIEIQLPSLQEQIKIAKILDKTDEIRVKREQAIIKLDKLAQGTFVEMFGNLVANPKKWNMVCFEKICPTRLGKMLDQKQQTGKNKKKYLRNATVRWFSFDLGDLLEMDFDEKAQETFKLEAGDILICEGGEPGRAAVWMNEVTDCYYQKALHRGRVNSELATPEYVVWLLWTYSKFGGLKDFTTSSTIAHLTSEKLKAMPVPLPPLPLQKEFSKVTNVIKTLKQKYEQDYQKSIELTRALQHQAFTTGFNA